MPGLAFLLVTTIVGQCATAQVRVQPATWNSSDSASASGRQGFRETSSADVRPGQRLAWGASGNVQRVRHASAFAEIRPEAQNHVPSEPNLFPSQSDDARRAARIQAAASARRIRTVSAVGELQQPAHVAGRIPMDASPFGDVLAAPPISGPLASDPHLDPFGDAVQQTPTVSLSPTPAVVKPIQLDSSQLPVIPEFEPIAPLNTKPAAPLTLNPAPEPIPDFAPVKPVVVPIPEPVVVPEPEPQPEPEPESIPIAEPIANPPPAAAVPTKAVSPKVVPQALAPKVAPKALAPIPSRTPVVSPEPQINHQIRQPLPGIQRSDDNLDLDSFVSQPELSQIGPELRIPSEPPASPSLDDPFNNDEPKSVPEFPEYQGDKKEAADDLPAPKDDDQLPEVSEPPRPGEDAKDDSDDLFTFPGGDKDDTEENEEDPDEEDEDDKEDEDESDEDEASKKQTVRCDRVYNDRNCCEQDQLCGTTAAKLLETRIQDLSVSITPPLVPLAEDETEVEEQRERLAESPVHEWTNRQGTLIATGRLVDFKDESVIVETTEGYRISIPYFNLGHNDLCFLTAWWRLPGECLLAGDDRALRNFQASTFTWKASAMCHKPLYFEEVQLERYGHSAGPILQPLLSGAHFISNIQLLPYNVGVYPASECRYTLGHYKPGSCAPWLIPAFPLSHRGVAWEMGAAFGLWGLF